MVTSCSSADMIPDSLWTECLTEIKSSHSESAIDLMTHLITETENQTILQQVCVHIHLDIDSYLLDIDIVSKLLLSINI